MERDKVVRVGGRSNDRELNNISLNTLRREAIRTGDCRDQVQIVAGAIGEVKDEIREEFKKLQNVREFHLNHFFQILPEKIHQDLLLLECPWEKYDVRLFFGGHVDEEGYKQQRKKKGKKGGGKETKMTREKVLHILKDEETSEKYAQSFDKLKFAALRAWLPSQQQFDEFENELIGVSGKRANVRLKFQEPKDLRNNKEKVDVF